MNRQQIEAKLSEQAAALGPNLMRKIVEAAREHMAQKAGCSTDDIAAVVLADPAGNAARRFATLVVLGMRTAQEIRA